jgi:ABC-type amino acid transport substrate-binding protein
MARPEIDYVAAITEAMQKFPPDVRIHVRTFVDLAASENKTGRIAQSRELSIVCELGDVLVASDERSFGEALATAIKKPAPNVNYIKAVLKSRRSKASLGDGLAVARAASGGKVPDAAKQTERTWIKDARGRRFAIPAGTNAEQAAAKIAEADGTPLEAGSRVLALKARAVDATPIDDMSAAGLAASVARRFAAPVGPTDRWRP